MRLVSPTLALALAACTASPPVVDTGVRPAPASAVSASELRGDLMVFASDSFRGRETGTPGERAAVDFLAARLAALGVQPAGDSGYFQRVPLVRQRFGPETRVAVTTGGRTTDLPIGARLLPILSIGAGVNPRLRAEGEIVFAGYGAASPELGRDDLKDLDVRDKVVVVINDAPPGADSARRAALSSQEALGQRLMALVPRGPAAIIFLLGGKFGEDFRQFAPQLLESMEPAGAQAEIPDSARTFPMILLGVPEAGSPLLPAGWPADDRPQALGRTLGASIELVREPASGYNVVAMVPGSDPALRGTYVAFGAHLDHIGVQPAVNGDSIANGADDDGSGSTTLLALARAFQRTTPRPKRSILFVWHTAEEKGLFGSAYFTQHPTVPIDSIVAQLNADMIGRNGPDSLYIVGPGAAPNGQSRVLGAIVDSVNAAEPRPFTFDREWDTQTHPERIYYRSDHYNYARRGIPIVFFTTGLHDDYHKVSDEPQKIDYEKMARVADLMYDVGVAVGNRTTRPK